MNNSTDSTSFITTPDGRRIQLIAPGALTRGSKNWRLTEAAYRRYESHIREALDAWPKETCFFVPDGMSPNTFEHRLRDALQAIKAYGYDLDVQQKLASIRQELVVSMTPDGKAVWIRAKQKAGRPIQIHKNVANTRVSTPAVDIQPTPDESVLRTHCETAKSGERTSPVHFRGRIDPQLCSIIEADYDTAFVYDDMQDTTTML